MKKKICLFILVFIFIPMLAMAQYSVPFWQFMEYATANWGALDPNGIFHQIGVDENGKFCFKYKDGTVTKFTSSSGGAEINKNLTIKSTDPSIIFDVDPNATDTNFWIGVQADAEDDDDDKFQIGDGTTEGTNPFVTVDTSGNVGIGTTSPSQKLEVNGNILQTTGDYLATDEVRAINSDGLKLYDDGSNGIFVKDGGDIGIGISSPTSKLDIQKSGTAKSNLDILELTNSVNAADMDGTETSIIFNKWYYDANTPAVADAARISVGTEQDWTSTGTTQDGYLAFKTTLDGTMTEWVRINSAGNVGIGTTNPTQLLEIHDDDTFNPSFVLFPVLISNNNSAGVGGTGGFGVKLQHDKDGSNNKWAAIAAISEDDYSNSIGLNFYTGSIVTPPSEKVRIDSFGNVGIGTASPINTLDVEGSINQRDYFWEDEFDYEASGVEFESGLTADFWVTAGTNYASADVTFTAGPGGTLQPVTHGADDDSAHITGVSNFRVNSNAILEARFKVADITNVYIVAGFVEGSYDDKGTHDDDIFVVGIDSDDGHGYGADQIVAISNDNAGGATYMDTNTPMVNNTYIIIKIDLTDTEQPRVWIDNTEIAAARITGTVQAGISISPYFMVQSLSGAADTATIDYIKCWQDRS